MQRDERLNDLSYLVERAVHLAGELDLGLVVYILSMANLEINGHLDADGGAPDPDLLSEKRPLDN